MRAVVLRGYLLSFPGSVETFPFGPETSVFKVEGKMFALSRLAQSALRVSLKCEPLLAEQLRAAHTAVLPGYHLNKRHWNTVIIDGSLPEQMIKDMIEDSYDLVVSRLPEYRRRALGWEEDSMADLEEPQFRLAGPADAEAVAKLHADSWRRHYRGAYSDAFLDGDVLADRMAVWTDRLREPDPRRCTMLAEDGSLVGFSNTQFGDDPTWGALLDNLHVADGHKRRGIASRLLSLMAAAINERPERTGLYLWVLEQNVEAQAFYEARGGRCVGRDLVSPPGGIASRVTGSPAKLRYAWPGPTVALGQP